MSVEYSPYRVSYEEEGWVSLLLPGIPAPRGLRIIEECYVDDLGEPMPVYQNSRELHSEEDLICQRAQTSLQTLFPGSVLGDDEILRVTLYSEGGAVTWTYLTLYQAHALSESIYYALREASLEYCQTRAPRYLYHLSHHGFEFRDSDLQWKHAIRTRVLLSRAPLAPQWLEAYRHGMVEGDVEEYWLTLDPAAVCLLASRWKIHGYGDSDLETLSAGETDFALFQNRIWLTLDDGEELTRYPIDGDSLAELVKALYYSV